MLFFEGTFVDEEPIGKFDQSQVQEKHCSL